MPRCLPLWSVFLVTAACFGTPPTSLDGPDRALPLALSVEDAEGAALPQDEVPRDPRLTLSFEERAPASSPQALTLLAGVFEPPLLARLSALRGGSVFKARMHALSVVRSGSTLHAEPAAPLDPGARYSLAWFAGAASTAYALQVSTDPSQGARLVESFPGDGERSVPRALARALLRFDGRVRELAAHVALLGDVAADVTAEPCEATGLPAGDCAWITPHTALSPGEYRIVVSAGARADTGAPLAATQTSFTVVDEAPALALQPMRCALDEVANQQLCVRVADQTVFLRGAVNVPALVSTAGVASLTFAGSFELAVPLASGQHSVQLSARDLAGRQTELSVPFDLTTPLAQVTIDELRADPLGDEPAQEYVELLNFGTTPVSMMGFSLTRDEHALGRTITSSTSLAAGERALVVAPSFDPRDLADGALPSGVRLLYLDGSLSLANGGDQLLLRDALGRRLAFAHSFPGLLEGQCSARFRSEHGIANERSDDVRSFELDPLGSCTPGTATFPRP